MKRHILTMANYNAWANARLFEMALGLPDDLYRKDVGAYFGSLHGTLNHLLVADSIWMRRLTGTGDHPARLDAIMFDDLPSLYAARQTVDQRIIAFAQSLSDADLNAIWEYQTIGGVTYRQTRRDTLAHVFNHQTHHRGQAHTILTILGVTEPDSLDLLTMQREQQ